MFSHKYFYDIFLHIDNMILMLTLLSFHNTSQTGKDKTFTLSIFNVMYSVSGGVVLEATPYRLTR